MQPEPLNSRLSFPPKVAIGADSFRELVENSTVFVDKSMLIKEFLTDANKVALVTYPRRWGKTINMNMIKTFLEIEVDDHGIPLTHDEKRNTALFVAGKRLDGEKGPLNIWHEREIVDQFFGRYPIIYVNFKDTKGNNYDEIQSAVISKINELFSQHKYLLDYIKNDKTSLIEAERDDLLKCFTKNIDITTLKNSLKSLSKALFCFFNQHVFILIDEYDTGINDTYLSFKDVDEIDKVLKLFRGILSGALKENSYLKKGLVTGIYRIAKADLFSGVNNFQEYGILTEEYSRHYGFTQDEVDQLFYSYDVPSDLAQDVKNWYNGYNFRSIEVYNPWSILNCLAAFQYRIANTKKTHDQIKSEILQSYWEESGNISFVLRLLKHELIKTYTERLIDNQPITFDLQTQLTMDDFNELRNLTILGSNYKITSAGIGLLFSYLFFGGYLTVYELPALFVLPNKEMAKEMAAKLLQYYQAEYTIDAGLFQNVTDKVQIILDTKLKVTQLNLMQLIEDLRLAMQKLLKALPKFQEVTMGLEELADDETIYHGNEDLVHSIMNYVVLQVRTLTRFATEIGIGKGRADIAFIDSRNGCAAIIELKYNQSVDEALEQIKERAYARDVICSYNSILLGINVLPDKSVEVKHEIIDKVK